MGNLLQNEVMELCERLRRIPVAVVSDVMAFAGLTDQVVASSIYQLNPAPRFSGPAACFSGEAGPERSTLTGAARLIYDADRRLTQGSVAVVGTGGFTVAAVLGGNTLAGWRKRGCVGVISDGLARDVADLGDFPTFASGVTPLSSQGRWAYLSLEAPVALPGQSAAQVIVHPGDIVHGDRDGVIVIPRRHLAQMVADAEIAEGVEQHMHDQIEAGHDRGEVYLSNDRFGHIRPVGR